MQVTGEQEALIKFADPGVLDGVKSRLKPVMKLSGVTFSYPGTSKEVLSDVSVKLCMASRIALVGPNGAGLPQAPIPKPSTLNPKFETLAPLPFFLFPLSIIRTLLPINGLNRFPSF
jgi:hypothetical protein